MLGRKQYNAYMFLSLNRASAKSHLEQSRASERDVRELTMPDLEIDRIGGNF